MLRRYHKEVFFEVGVIDEINALIDAMEIRPTKHFMDNWVKRGNVCIPTKNIIRLGEIFEYYRDDKTQVIDRFAVRCTTISKDYDVTYVINNVGRLVTSWVNTKEELHQNLRKEMYEGGARSGDILPSKRTYTAQRSKAGSRCESLIREWKRKKYNRSSKSSWNR